MKIRNTSHTQKPVQRLAVYRLFGLIGAVALSPLVRAQDLVPEEIVATLKESADWQLANRTESNFNGWIIAPFYDGLLRVAAVTGDANYMASVIRYGNVGHWAPGDRTYHADDQAVGHAWLDVYLIDPTKSSRFTPMRNRLDYVIANPITEDIEFGKPISTPGVQRTDRWTWCDALYMAPPTLARLYAATDDTKYLEFLRQEYQYTYDVLYDAADGFFYRDSTYLDDRTPNGEKVFWSRGNGWVYGGLALLLDYLPENHEDRPFYEALFQEMTVAVLGAQQEDGLWRPSLADPAHIPVGETSGSGFFTFGLAWGVNAGLLDRETHWPAVEAGWRGLLTRLGANGLVGYVQQPGAAPASFTANSTKEYGTGAFLLAGSEVLRGIGGAATVPLAELLAEAELIVDPAPPYTTQGLINLSTRLTIAADEIAIQGFVGVGATTVQVLIRAVGPSLDALGVSNPVPDPHLTLYDGPTAVASNDNWDPEAIGNAFAHTGAFAFAPGSLDSALIVSILPQHEYTVHVTGGAAGTVLIEVYEIP